MRPFWIKLLNIEWHTQNLNRLPIHTLHLYSIEFPAIRIHINAPTQLPHSQRQHTKTHILYSSFWVCIIWCFSHVKWSFTFPKDTKYQLNANASACDTLSWPVSLKWTLRIHREDTLQTNNSIALVRFMAFPVNIWLPFRDVIIY